MTYVLRLYHAARLFVLFLWDLWTSSLQVAAAVLSPADRTRPRLVTVPLRARSDLEITLVGNFISLTPGTLTVDVSPERDRLLVHDLFAGSSSEGTREAVRKGIEARVLKVTR